MADWDSKETKVAALSARERSEDPIESPPAKVNELFNRDCSKGNGWHSQVLNKLWHVFGLCWLVSAIRPDFEEIRFRLTKLCGGAGYGGRFSWSRLSFFQRHDCAGSWQGSNSPHRFVSLWERTGATRSSSRSIINRFALAGTDTSASELFRCFAKRCGDRAAGSRECEVSWRWFCREGATV